MVLVYTTNSMAEKELESTACFKIAEKDLKCLGINLSRNAEGPYNGNDPTEV